MLDIVTYLWHDPLLEGPRQRHVHTSAGSLRPDLVPSGRRLRRMVLAGKQPPPDPFAKPGKPPSGPRAFKPEHVNRLAQLFKKHLSTPHRFVCVADSPEGFSNDVHFHELGSDARFAEKLRSPEGNRFPTCYRRLWGFSEAAAAFLGRRALVIDIDLVPVRNLSPIVERDEPFVGWRPFRDWGRKLRIGGGIYLMTPGAHTEVWEKFRRDPLGSIAAARGAGFRGSDQAWLSYCLAEKVPIYPRTSGIYSIRDLDTSHALPADARLVQFNGPTKPWDYRGPASWVATHWNGR